MITASSVTGSATRYVHEFDPWLKIAWTVGSGIAFGDMFVEVMSVDDGVTINFSGCNAGALSEVFRTWPLEIGICSLGFVGTVLEYVGFGYSTDILLSCGRTPKVDLA
jgi:hypothetical protein